jgi:hypothetical protein
MSLAPNAAEYLLKQCYVTVVEQTYANKDFPENISKYGNCN